MGTGDKYLTIYAGEVIINLLINRLQAECIPAGVFLL